MSAAITPDDIPDFFGSGPEKMPVHPDDLEQLTSILDTLDYKVGLEGPVAVTEMLYAWVEQAGGIEDVDAQFGDLVDVYFRVVGFVTFNFWRAFYERLVTLTEDQVA